MKTNYLNKLASKIAKIEGKKHQASIGDIREILAIMGSIMIEADVEHRTKYSKAIHDSGVKRIKAASKGKKSK